MPSSGARVVALGILLSRLAGLVREKALAWFFGLGPYADVLRYALRAPNALQNLLGEQTLSAAFIPVYSRLLAAGREDDARRFAGAVFALLLVATSALALLGMVFAGPLVAILAPGLVLDAAKVAAGEFSVDRYPLTVAAVRVIFPMTAALVLSAWALGVLNSHRRFFLPYLAPVLWNAAILAALVAVAWDTGLVATPAVAGSGVLERWLFAVCWGALLGGLLQLAVQLPLVLRLLGGLRPSLRLDAPGVRDSLALLGPALAGRGVVQISLYLDQFLASWLKVGALSALGGAGLLYSLPFALFGASVAAAELPELAREAGHDSADEAGVRISERIRQAMRQTAFVVWPSVVGYLVFGYLAVALVFQGGRFTRLDNWLVYLVLGGYTLGLAAATLSRLLQNTFFALGDTRTPAKIAALRLVASVVVGALLMTLLDRVAVGSLFGRSPSDEREVYLGALGLSLATGLASWGELLLLLRVLRRRLPQLRLPIAHLGRRLFLAFVAALPALGLWLGVRGWSAPLQALVVLPAYAATYFSVAAWLRLPELAAWLGRRAPRQGPDAG